MYYIYCQYDNKQIKKGMPMGRIIQETWTKREEEAIKQNELEKEA